MSRRYRKKTKGEFFSALFILFILILFIRPEFIKSIFEYVLITVLIVLILGVLFYVFYSMVFKKNKHLVVYPESKLNSSQNKKLLKTKNSSIDAENIENKWSQKLINSLEWKRFEELCCEYFILIGYKAKLTGKGADGGVDIEIFNENYSPIKPYGIVQCKAWGSSKVGVRLIRELYGVMASEDVPLGVFVTTGGYTLDAVEFSKNKNLKLISGNELFKYIQLLPEKEQELLLKKITSGDFSTPTCPSCDIKMVLRTSKKGRNIGGKFWGCKNYPRCRSVLQIKT